MPQYNELFLFLVSGALTADTIVDCIRDTWVSIAERFSTVAQLAKTMTYKHVHPVVKQLTKTYATGVKLTHKALTELEQRFERLGGLEKYFVRIAPVPS